MKYLCGVWQKFDNVVAVELMNEPLVAGLPNLFYQLKVPWHLKPSSETLFRSGTTSSPSKQTS